LYFREREGVCRQQNVKFSDFKLNYGRVECHGIQGDMI
jgi:hypothetical protein